jgi:2-polyprenyl-6-hydroxyphenyl methylase/3-demethylubiquinone-9 3-methyltransferase
VNATRDNLDPRELAKFEALAEEWWDLTGPFRTLHEINPLRLDYVKARATLAGAKVLDVGCGGGLFSEALAAEGADVVGLDRSPTSLDAARRHAEAGGVSLRYIEEDVAVHAEHHPAAYDIVTCMELLEHVPDPEALVAACSRLVRPGGTVFFSTICRSLKSFLFAIVAAEHLLKLVPKGTHEYAKLIRPSELAAWCRACGLTVRDLSGLRFDPFTRDHRIGGTPDVNYLCHADRPRQ